MRLRALRSTALLFLLASAIAAQEAGSDFLRVTRPEPLPAPLAALVEGLDTTRITRHLAFLTDPARDGRGLGSLPARHLANRAAKRLAVRPMRVHSRTKTASRERSRARCVPMTARRPVRIATKRVARVSIEIKYN